MYKSHKQLTFLMFLEIIFLGAFFSSCEKGSKVLSLNKSDTGSDKYVLTKSSDGATSGEVNSQYRGTQIIEGSSSSGTEGSSIVFPAGSLAINATVSLGSASSLATSALSTSLGLGATFNSSGPAVLIGSQPAQNGVAPFTISIPTSGASLRLNDDENLVVIYEQFDAASNSYIYGLMTSDSFQVSSKKVKISVSKFGRYQVALVSKKVGAVSKSGKISEIPGVSPEPSASPASSSSSSSSNPTYLTLQSVTPTGGAGTARPNIYVLSSITGTVTLFGDSSCASTTYGTATITSTSTAGYFNPSTLPEGAYTFYGSITDTNGVSTCEFLTNFRYDVTSPTVAVSSTASAITNSSPIPFTITFSEDVTGFTQSGVTVSGGTVASLSGSGSNYSITVTPSAQGSVTVHVVASVAQDAAGNANTASSTFSRTFDSVSPTVVSVIGTTGTYVPGDFVNLTITFSESVDVSGTASSLQLALLSGVSAASYNNNNNGTTTVTYRYQIQAGDRAVLLDYQNTASLSVSAGTTIRDSAGNDAVLTLPTPGTSGSISYGATIVVWPETAPVLTADTIPVMPTEAGLTTRPKLRFTTNKTIDSIQVYQSGCGTAIGTPIAGPFSTGSVASATLNASLASSGSTSMSIIASIGSNPTVTSVCTPIGSYRTGVNKVVVATNSAAPSTWACAIVNGGLKCWGHNNAGQLGNNTTTQQTTPYSVYAENSGVTDVVLNADWNYATGNSTCAVVDGGAYCWGNNTYGQLGCQGTSGCTSSVKIPIQVFGLSSGVNRIYSSTGKACALVGTTLKCWGRNGGSSGLLGIGDSSSSYLGSPQTVGSAGNYLTSVTSVAMADSHTCAVNSGAAYCWGAEAYGEITGSSFGSYSLPYQKISSGVEKISADIYNSCALLSNGSVNCWGDDQFGQISNHTSITSATDVIAGQNTLYKIGSAFASAGINTYKQLYQTTASSFNSTILSPNTASVLSSSYSMTGYGTSTAEGTSDVLCLIISGGVYCRGHATSTSYTGIGTTTGAVVPTGSSVTQVDASRYLGCAVVNDNQGVQCWGSGTQGQLGNGGTTNSSTPVTVSSIP